MDITSHVCILLLVIVYSGHVHCEPESTTAGISNETLVYARCLARCYDLFGLEKGKTDEQDPSKVCESQDCLQCLSPCNISSEEPDTCGSNLCGEDEVCRSSCTFVQDVRKETKSLQDMRHSDSFAVLTAPDIVCKNVPYGRNRCPDPIATMYLKFNIGPGLLNTTPVFIISARYIHEWNELSNWTDLRTVTETFVEIPRLRCSTEYQFRITAVLPDRVYGQSKPTPFTKTPGYNYMPPPPESLSVSEPYLVNQKPSVTVTWDPGSEAPCYFKMFWFDQALYMQAEIKVPRKFSYQIDSLKFSKNYTIRLYSIDDAFQHTSEEDKHVYAITPDCLAATGYNHSVCAPEKPQNLTVEVLTPFHKDLNVRFINVSLSWEAPDFTHNGDDVIRYILVYRKEPPYDVAIHLEPHKDEVVLNGSQTSVTLLNLHNHNLYSFRLSAETTGGKGETEFFKVYIGLYTPEETFTGEPDMSHQNVKDSSTSLTVTEILSVVLVPVVLFIILIFVIGFIIAKRRRKYKKYPSKRRFGPVEEMNPIYDGMALNIDSEKKAQFAMDGYEIDYSCLDFISVIGEGAFGKVVKAEYYPNPGDRGNQQGKIVAVKMLRDFYTGDESRNFLLEIQAMKNLGHYPYIVSIIGCCLTGPKLCLIMDYCALGDLRNYLRKYREKLMYSISSPYGMMTKAPNCYMQDQIVRPEKQNSDGSGNSDETIADVSEAQLLSYARQVTMGMEFLEERKFVHRDLAARNILLFDHRHAKISDFGLTRDVYETNVYQPTSARKLPYKWMAIESLFSQRFTVKSDVWSFGIVLWEIVTLGGSPYPSIPLKDLYGLLNDGYRMEKPENCSTKIYQIMLSCWHPNPHSRPTFTQLRQELEKLLEETMSYIDLSVEVSEDYFNESTNESNVVGYQTSESKDTLAEMDTEKSQELFVDIHKQPISIDTLHELTAGNDISEGRIGYDDSDYLESTLSRTCDFCGDERPLLDGKLSNKTSNCTKCISCANDNRTKSVDSLKGKPTHLVKSVFQDSLRNLLENVAYDSILSKPSSKKQCFSLTNINNSKDIHSTSL